MTDMPEDKSKATMECDYLNVRLVLTESVVPEQTELTVTPPFRSGDMIEFTIGEHGSAEDEASTIQLNPKQIEALVQFLSNHLPDQGLSALPESRPPHDRRRSDA